MTLKRGTKVRILDEHGPGRYRYDEWPDDFWIEPGAQLTIFRFHRAGPDFPAYYTTDVEPGVAGICLDVPEQGVTWEVSA